MPVSLESLKYYAEELQDKEQYYQAFQVYEKAYNFISTEMENEEYKDFFSDKKIIRDIIVNLSYCCERIENYEKSSYFIKRAFAMFKDDPEITYRVMKDYLLHGNLKRSAELYITVAQVTSDEEKAKLLLHAGDRRDSYNYASAFIKILRNAMELPFVKEDDKTLFSNKIVEVDSKLKHPKITTCILTKNDGKKIKECLESVQKFSFEILVIDCGSTDNTKEIVSEYTNILDYEFNNNYSDAKNYCIEKAKGDWILFIDPNQYLSKETEENILSYLYYQVNEDPYSLYCFSNIDTEKMGSQLIFYYRPSLFRNKLGIKFKRPIHEEIYHPERELKKVYCFSMEIKTESSQRSEEEFLEEELLYRKILNNAILNNPDTDDNYYYYHFSAINYSIHGEKKKALEDHYKALGLYKQKFPNKKDSFYLYLLMGIVKFLADKTENFDALKAFCDKVLEIKPDYPDVMYYLGTYYEKIGEIDNAISLYQKALELLQDKWYRVKNTDLPSIGEQIIYTLSDKFESFVW